MNEESGLGEAESIVEKHLIDAWNEWCKIENLNEYDKSDFLYHFHALQRILQAKSFRDLFPDYWRK